MNLGLTLMEAGDYERAKALFVDAQRLLPNYSTVEVNLGIIESHLATPEVAEPHFVRALELSPAHPAPHRYYARWLIQQGRTLEALPHLDYALRVSPADLEVRHMLMSIDAARGAPELMPLARETHGFAADDSVSARYATYRTPFDDAPTGRPGLDAAWARVRGRGAHADAAQAYRAALAADSTNADAWNNLGWSLAKLGLYEDALPAFDAAERHHPGDGQVARNRAWAVDQLADARYRQAFALQQTDRPAEAASIYRSLIETYPRWVNAHYNLAYALMTAGRHEAAAAEFARTLELDPALTAAHFNRAACLDSLGRTAEAQGERAAYDAAHAATAAR
jgi:tetratricopeptide (TPR) repeat protein